MPTVTSASRFWVRGDDAVAQVIHHKASPSDLISSPSTGEDQGGGAHDYNGVGSNPILTFPHRRLYRNSVGRANFDEEEK